MHLVSKRVCSMKHFSIDCLGINDYKIFKSDIVFWLCSIKKKGIAWKYRKIE
jgi:hypothetical protein